MKPTPEQLTTTDDPRLLNAVQEYLAELEAGRRPDARVFVQRHAEVAAELRPYLDALDVVHAAGAVIHEPNEERGTPSGALAGEPLGDFRLLREIGRGGMGVVYEAEQLSLGRRVAVKVLPFAAALDNKQLQRFKNEARAAAQLHHNNIVPVYAVGCERGVHFYAMQLIEGQNIATLIEELRHSAPRGASEVLSAGSAQRTGPYPESPAPQEGLTDTRTGLGMQLSTQRSNRVGDFYRTVVRLIVQAAQGLDYAHSLGVVHRDVKPANLLVDLRGNVWVTDFGLAQFHADVGVTQTGDLVGTLRYMSPEQAGGQRALIDHRTDIYSMGATLYELLTLRPIFDGTDRQALLQQILNEEARHPRTIDRSIPDELETIVLKAISKIPTERYATAQELADDLQRFLDDQPIRARRPSNFEKATKWARRHKSVVISGLTALLLSVAILAVATVLTTLAWNGERQKAQEADEQRKLADEQRKLVDEQRKLAEASFRQAWQAVDQFALIGEEELVGDPRLEGLRRRLLEVALSYYQNFSEERRDDPTIQNELVASRAKVKAIIDELTTLMGAARYTPLRQDEVKDELKLTPEQREAIARIDEKWREGFRKFDRLDATERDRRRLLLAQEQETEVARLLTQAQMKRLNQLAVQFLGPNAFSDPDVVKVLKLTTEQKKQVRNIQEQWRGMGPGMGPGPGPLPGPGGPGGGPGRGNNWWEKFEDSKKHTLEKLVAILTPTQKQKWDNLVGPAFAFKPPSFRFPDKPHGGPRRGGGGS